MIDKNYQLKLNISLIKKLMEEQEMKYSDLCEKMGCDTKTLRKNVFNQGKGQGPALKLSFINNLALALNVNDPLSLLIREEI